MKKILTLVVLLLSLVVATNVSAGTLKLVTEKGETVEPTSINGDVYTYTNVNFENVVNFWFSEFTGDISEGQTRYTSDGNSKRVAPDNNYTVRYQKAERDEDYEDDWIYWPPYAFQYHPANGALDLVLDTANKTLAVSEASSTGGGEVVYKLAGDFTEMNVTEEVVLTPGMMSTGMLEADVNVVNIEGSSVVVNKYVDEELVATFGLYDYDEEEEIYYLDTDVAAGINVAPGVYHFGFLESEGMGLLMMQKYVFSYALQGDFNNDLMDEVVVLNFNGEQAYGTEVTVSGEGNCNFVVLKALGAEFDINNLSATLGNAAEETVLSEDGWNVLAEGGNDFVLPAGTYSIGLMNGVLFIDEVEEPVVPEVKEEKVYYTFKTEYNTTNNSYGSTYDVTIEGMDWSVPGNQYSDYLRIGGKNLDKTDRNITGKTAMGSEISKIVISTDGLSNASLTVNSITVTVASDEDFTENVVTETVLDLGLAKDTAKDIVIAPAQAWAKDSYYKVTFNFSNSTSSNYFVKLKDIKFYHMVSVAPHEPVVSYKLIGDLDGNGEAEIELENIEGSWGLILDVQNADAAIKVAKYFDDVQTIVYGLEENVTMEFEDSEYNGTLGAGLEGGVAFGARGEYVFNLYGMNDETVGIYVTLNELYPEVVTVEKNFTIVYKDRENGDNNAAFSTAEKYNEVVESGADYANYNTSSNVYDGATGLKFSSSSNNGSITLDFTADYQKDVTKVVVNAAAWKSTNGSVDAAKLSVNNSDAQELTADLADYTFNMNGSKLTSLTLSATKRLYVKSVTVYYNEVVGEDKATIAFDGDYVQSKNVYKMGFNVADNAEVHYSYVTGADWTYDQCVAAFEDGSEVVSGVGDSNIVLTFSNAFMIKAYASVEGMENSEEIAIYIPTITMTGVSSIAADNSAVEYFKLDGTRVAKDNVLPGIYVRRQGNVITKVIVK